LDSEEELQIPSLSTKESIDMIFASDFLGLDK